MPDFSPLCPNCTDGLIIPRKSVDGKPFYGCNRFPRCGFTSKFQPRNEPCPHCSSAYLLEKPVRKVLWAVCPNRDCKFERRLSAF
ncbi:topoisomerase DNA-binding C4 zinc finger domain-containing protein [Bryobacter aggregatus]|uniref:DNA topoisomerase family protein n=1 Tax=Bryobacter aggregatus TaxID=360054 RepID=UPI0009B5D138